MEHISKFLPVSMLLHSGIWPSYIAAATSESFDLIGGWLLTPQGKRPRRGEIGEQKLIQNVLV